MKKISFTDAGLLLFIVLSVSFFVIGCSNKTALDLSYSDEAFLEENTVSSDMTYSGIPEEWKGVPKAEDKEKYQDSTEQIAESVVSEYYTGDDTEEKARQGSFQKHIKILDREYVLAHSVRTYLVLGTDGSGDLMAIGDDYRGDFTDSIIAVVVDDEKKTAGAIQIDRNTMVNVPVLNYMGEEGFTYYMQICVASIYGGNMNRGEKNLCSCVSELLGGIDIDGFYAIPVQAIPVLNDTVGGVTVTIDEDLTAVDSSFKKDSEITLYGDQAEAYLRNRKDVSDGLNRSRMHRHQVYVNSFINTIKSRMQEDSEFVSSFFKTMRHETYTDIALEELINGALTIKEYDNLGVFTPEGVAEFGETFNDGILLEENHMNYRSLQQIMETLYPLVPVDE